MVFEKVLLEAIGNDTCKNRIDNRYNWMGPIDYRIDRQSLIEYANHINQKPAFLFPDVRTLPEQQVKTESQGTSTKETKKNPKKKLSFTYNDKQQIVLYFDRNKQVVLTKLEGKMFLFLKEDKRTLQEIFEHIWPEDGNKTSDNAHGLRRQLNIKGSKLDIESLVSEQIEGYYKLTFEEVVER